MIDNPHGGKTIVIAEVKLWSPTGKRLTKNSRERQLELAALTGDIVSIHTHPIWQGSFDHITEARKRLGSSQKILAKGFHGSNDEVKQALDAGADYVLVVGFIPTIHLDKCFLEPLDFSGLQQIDPNQWAVWNSRQLATLKGMPGVSGIPQYLLEAWDKKNEDNWSDRKWESFKEAREVFLGRLCQASNLKTRDDIEPGATAVLVGSNLESFADSLGIRL